MRCVTKVGIAVAVVAVGVAAPAAADPISVTYRVDISSQCRASEGSNGVICGAYTSSFPLTLTFDSAITRVFVSGARYQEVFYGAATVSDIPLPQRPDYPPLPVTDAFTIEAANGNLSTNAWRHGADAYIRHYALIDHTEYYNDLRLSAEDFSSTMPQLGAQSFATFLGTAPTRNFFFGVSAELASGGFETIAYNGTFSLEATPTPEPASMLLLGTGLGGLAWRMRRRAS